MNEIDFKFKSDNEFRRFVGLGGYCTNQDGIYPFLPQGDNTSTEEWIDFFNSSFEALLLLTFHEMVMSYRESKCSQDFSFGATAYTVIKNNEVLFNNFIDRWFDPLPESNFFFFPPLYHNFKGLNFNFDGNDMCIKKEYFDEDGNTIKIKLKNDAIMKIPDTSKEDAYLDYDQFFVLKSDYEAFVNELIELIGLFLRDGNKS